MTTADIATLALVGPLLAMIGYHHWQEHRRYKDELRRNREPLRWELSASDSSPK